MTDQKPTIGRIVWYRTDGRNGLTYDLPAIITCTAATHPGDYPDGRSNALPVPDDGCVHLTVFTPGGFGTKVQHPEAPDVPAEPTDDEQFVGTLAIVPGSGTYVEWNVPEAISVTPPRRTWRWP